MRAEVRVAFALLLVAPALASTVSPTPQPSAIPTSTPSSTPRFYFGLSAFLSHDTVGRRARDGVIAAFRSINDNGGVFGNMLDLIAYDDGGDPTVAMNNAQSFIDQKVLGCVSWFGLEGITSSLPMLAPHSIPMIGPVTGARSLRLPWNRYVVNIRASFDEEARTWVNYCLARGISSFSVYHDDSDDGFAGLDAMKFALANEGMNVMSTASFPAGTLNVSVNELLATNVTPQAITVVAESDAAAAFAVLAKKTWPSVLLYMTSITGATRLLKTSLPANNVTAAQSNDIFLTQVFPIPQPASTLPPAGPFWQPGQSNLLRDFAHAMNATCPTCPLSFSALEGFVAGKLIESVLAHMLDFSYNNSRFRPYLDAKGVNASSVAMDDENSLQAWRELFLDTLYKEAIFDVSGLRLGSYVENVTCTPNSGTCIQPEDPPCSQGMRNVYLTYANLANSSYLELPDWRTPTPFCNAYSLPTPPDELPLVFGQSALLSGAAAGLGTDMRNGIMAAFAEANKSPSKGVRSRKLILMTLEDSYLDVQAAINARYFINNQSLVAVVGALGSDPTRAVIPVYAAAGLPLIGTNAGDRFLRGSWAINVRAFYDDEVAGMVSFALSRGLKKISLFRQLAAFGQAGADALDLALKYHKLELHTVSGYPRGIAPNYTAVMNNLTRGGAPDVLILYSAVTPSIAVLKLAFNDSIWANTIFICGSVADIDRMQLQLPGNILVSGRVFGSAVVPPVGQDSFSGEFKNALKLIDSRLFFGQPFVPTLAALEGYLIGRLVIAALARVTQFTGAALLQDIHVTQGITIENFKLGPYTPECNMGLRDVYMLRLENGSTPFTQMSTFRPNSSNTFVPNCGAFPLYSDGNISCPDGYTKAYVNSQTLDSVCNVCLSPFGCELPERVANQPLRAGMLALNIIGFLIALVFMGVVIKYRETTTIKAVSPPFCMLILTGSMLGFIFVFVQYPAMPTEMSCMAQVYILNTASCLLFGSLFAKVYRVTQIFKPRKGNGFRVLAIRDSALFIGVGTMWVIEMIYTVIWHALNPLLPMHLSNPQEQYWICQNDEPLWGILDVLANALFLLYGVLLSIQSRKVPTLFNEAKFVAATMYNTLIVGGIAILLGFGLADNNDKLYLYKGLGCFVVFVVDIMLLIGSKFPALYGEAIKGIIPQYKKDSSSDASGRDTSEPKSSRDSTAPKSAAALSRIELEVHSTGDKRLSTADNGSQSQPQSRSEPEPK